MATAPTKPVVGCTLVKIGTLVTAGHVALFCGAACLQRNRLLLVDCGAGKVTIHDRSNGALLAVSDKLHSTPFDVCVLDKSSSQVAVTFWNGDVQILSVQSKSQSAAIRTLTTITTKLDQCYGVRAIPIRRQLLVSGLHHGMLCWCLLSYSGKEFGSIHKICKYRDLATYIGISNDQTSVFISCFAGEESPDTAVYGYDLESARCKFKYCHSDLSWPRGLCVDSRGYIYVCNWMKPACIHRLTENGDLVQVFKDMIPQEPMAMCLDETRQKLFMTCYGKIEVHRFSLQWNEGAKGGLKSIFQRLVRNFHFPGSSGKQTQQHEKDSAMPAEILHMDEGSLQMYKEALQHGKEKVYGIRVMVVGQYGVGKTTLIKRLFGEDVDITKRRSTEGIDVHVHCCRVSLDTWEWTRQNKEGDKYARLKRLFSILNDQAQKFRSSREQEEHSEVIYQRETTPELDAGANFDDSVTDKDMPSSSGQYTAKEIQSVSFSQAESLSIGVVQKHSGHHADTETSSVLKPEIQRNISSGSEGKDPMVELLKMINENAAELEKSRMEYAELTMCDFAGQYVFYTTHQMFLSSRAIYLLVTDLNQQVSDPVTDDECFFDSEGIKLCKVHDFVEIWLNSIHSCAASPVAGIPPVVLVGTHVDKIPEESRKKVTEGYFQQIRSILRDKPTRFHLANDDFIIDNTQCDPRLENLKRKLVELASNQPCWGEEVPARWLSLEQAIMTLKTSGIKVVALSFVKKLNQAGPVQIETEKELDLFLRFQHEKGIIIYFSAEGLKEKIVLDPKWLIDALTSLITAKMFILRNNPSIIEKWYEFQKTGKLMPELVDAVWSKEKNPNFFHHKDHILRLMEQLNIIAKPRSFSDSGEEVMELHAEKEVEKPISCVPQHLQDEHPSEQSLSRLSFRIGQEFHILGLELGIPETEIQQIQKENPRVSTQCFMILIRWTRRNASQATFKNLEKALLKVGSDTGMLKTLDETEDSVSCLSPEVLDKRPTEQELKKISNHVGKELIHLGVELGIHLARIEQIRLEYPHSVARQSLEMLFEWRRINVGQETFRSLERAFRGACMDVNILKQVLQT